MERQRVEEEIKKGPWTAEEDEVLTNFVNKYGPKDWSSIRSMGLLPRTGKSCRLRWVNKLRPNLKIGCKFSAEEERVVIDLQARFGNKWATIASYLTGRTDNDVKNFWSTRQKRLARILHSSPSRIGKSQKSKGKALAVQDMPTLKEKEESTSNCQSCPSSSMAMMDPEMLQIMPLMTPNLINVYSSLPSLDLTETDHNKFSTDQTPPLQLSFTQQPYTRVRDLIPESHDSVLGLSEPNFADVFSSSRQAPELENVSQFNFGSPFLEFEKLAAPESFFDDLPSDLFDSIEPIPSSSPL